MFKIHWFDDRRLNETLQGSPVTAARPDNEHHRIHPSELKFKYSIKILSDRISKISGVDRGSYKDHLHTGKPISNGSSASNQ